MSRTTKDPIKADTDLHTKWQNERGPRYGNLRHQMADLKVRQRRIDRAGNKVETQREIRED